MVKRKGNGEGTIAYHKGSNRYQAQYTVNGKRKTIYQKKGETITEFKKRFNKMINEVNSGNYIDKSRKTFAEIASEYIENKYRTNKVTPSIYLRDKSTLKQIEVSCRDVFNMPIQNITVYHIRQELINLTKYSNSCISHIYRLMNKAFKIALSDRLIPFKPMDNENVIKPQSDMPNKKIEALTLEEHKNY